MAIISISDSQVNGADQILVADSNSKIPAKDGSQITILNATNVTTGTIASARLDTGTTANKLVLLDSSGNLPAVDASLLTGIVSATISASDPTISTNPSGGVGTEWLNSTSGEMYICTDATAGANVWTNVGAGSDNIQPWLFQGTQYGYHFGSNDQDNGSVNKYSFTSDGNATDVATVTVSRNTWVGFTAETHGYLAGGDGGGGNVIDRIEYASDSSMSDVGDMITARRSSGGSNNETYGYIHGGYRASPAATVDVIERFQMAASASGADVGDLTVARNYPGGNSDVGNNYGYCVAGYPSGNNVIDRYQMVASANATDVGDLIQPQASMASQSTETYGYQSGGGEPSQSNYIRKFAFGSSVTSTDTGNLTVARFDTCGTSSTTYGYSAGGIWPDALNTTIDKFSFAADSDATDVGDLAQAGGRYNGPTGAQY